MIVLLVWWLALYRRRFLVLISSGALCVECACSPHACVGPLQVYQLPPTVQRHACYVNGSESECTWLFVSVLALLLTGNLSNEYPVSSITFQLKEYPHETVWLTWQVDGLSSLNVVNKVDKLVKKNERESSTSWKLKSFMPFKKVDIIYIFINLCIRILNGMKVHLRHCKTLRHMFIKKNF